MIDFLHTLTGPPLTVTTLSTYKGKKNTECIVTWTYPKQPSYLARIDAVDLKRVKEVANQTFINKPVAVAGYGPVASLPSIEWFREKVHV